MVSMDDSGVCQFKLHRPDARCVQLLGDFTHWERAPVEMLRTPSGWWRARLGIERGDHHFQYLIDGTIWLADFAAHGVYLNHYGLWVSQLCVQAKAPLIQDPSIAPHAPLRIAA